MKKALLYLITALSLTTAPLVAQPPQGLALCTLLAPGSSEELPSDSVKFKKYVIPTLGWGAYTAAGCATLSAVCKASCSLESLTKIATLYGAWHLVAYLNREACKKYPEDYAAFHAALKAAKGSVRSTTAALYERAATKTSSILFDLWVDRQTQR